MHNLFDMAVVWVANHPTTAAVGSFWLFSNAVSAMPTPTEASSTFYRWAFGFLHSVAGNAARLVATKFPGAASALGISPGEPKP